MCDWTLKPVYNLHKNPLIEGSLSSVKIWDSSSLGWGILFNFYLKKKKKLYTFKHCDNTDWIKGRVDNPNPKIRIEANLTEFLDPKKIIKK